MPDLEDSRSRLLATLRQQRIDAVAARAAATQARAEARQARADAERMRQDAAQLRARLGEQRRLELQDRVRRARERDEAQDLSGLGVAARDLAVRERAHGAAADRRDREADDRDRVADQREAAADERDRMADEREAGNEPNAGD